MIKDVKLVKGMSKEEVNKLLRDNDVELELVDEVYEGGRYKHNWICGECNSVFKRTWEVVKYNNSLTCIKCSTLKMFKRRVQNNENKVLKNICDISNIKLISHMTKDEVNEIIGEFILLEDEEYKGVDILHNWTCFKCGKIFHKTWWNIKERKNVECDDCTLNNDNIESIKDITLKSNMTRFEVNKLIGKWILLEDDNYIKNNYKHNWRCKCGNIIEGRQWGNIKNRNSIKCKKCIHYDMETTYINRIKERNGYTYIKALFSNDVLLDGSIVKDRPYIRVKHRYCGTIYDISPNNLFNIKQDCSHCCGSYKNSFAYHIIEEVEDDIKDKILNTIIKNSKNKDVIEKYKQIKLNRYWDFDKNTVNPYHIWKNNNIDKIWLRCTREYQHKSYETRGNIFVQSIRNLNCPYCRNINVEIKNSLGYLYPEIAKMIVCYENGNKIKNIDLFTLAPKVKNKFYLKCNKCGNVNTKPISLNNVTKQGFTCDRCSDGISIPEKFMSNILKQLNVEYINEFGKNNVTWIKDRRRYDFYIPPLNMIIETHGEQHYKENKRVESRTLDEEQENDIIKKELALNNGIENYITIDCRYSKLEWLKDNITKELSPYVDLSNINWNLAWEESQNSLCVKAWELWNDGYSVKEISEELNVSTSPIRSYLHKGTEIGICVYDGKVEVIKSNKLKKKINKTLTLSLNDISYKFESVNKLCEFLNISDKIYYKYIKTNNYIINTSLINNKNVSPGLQQYDGFVIKFNKEKLKEIK